MKTMKRGNQKRINRINKLALLFGAVIIGFTSCSKDDPKDSNDDARTQVVLAITNNEASPKSSDSKVDLTKVTLAKVEYLINQGDNAPDITVVKNAELIMAGDSLKIKSIDNRIFNFKTGSTMVIQSVDLYGAEGIYLGYAAIPEPDTFTLVNDPGTKTMERIYKATSKATGNKR